MPLPDGSPQPSTADGMLLGRTFGRYEFLTLIDRGGMASVFVARSVGVAGFERLVAVKVLHPHMAHEEEFVSMFLDEARLAARIRHPNVVATLDVSDSEGEGYFMVMEYIEGDHLGALLKQAARHGERLPAPVASRILLDALAGLGAAHRLTNEQGQPMALVHRDVSPQNVLVGTDGIARLTDFGIAKADVRLTSTREGQFKGKVTYMAPEQATDGAATQKSDLFSTGIVLWEALTGSRLFLGENHAATLYKILEDAVPKPSSVDPALTAFDAVVERALAREPHDRYPNAEEFAEALELAASQAGGLATQRTVSELVARYVGPKIEAEASRVREAIDQLGKAKVVVAPRPAPRSSAPDAAPSDLFTPAPSADVTVADGALVIGHEPRRYGGRAKLAAMGGAVLLLASAAAAVYFGRSRSDAERVAPAAAPTDARPFAPTASVAAEPAPSASVAPTPSGANPKDEAARVEDLPSEPAIDEGRRRSHERAPKASAPKESPAPAPKASPKESDFVSNPYRQ